MIRLLLSLPLCLCVTAAVAVAQEEAGPSFRHEVVPVLTRLGCNMGSCHGKQAGQNGFRLSLRGYAPELDHEWVTREFDGRRVNRTRPDESLLLLKPLGRMPHGGGRVMEPESRYHDTLRRWIAAGTPTLREGEPRLERLEVTPGRLTLQPGQSGQLTVRAMFDDGSTRDVTWLAQFFSSDESLLSVDADGHLKCLRPGEGTVRVHFEDLVSVVTVTAPYPHTLAESDFAGARNDVDRHVFAKLRELRLPPSGLCDDATFIRRAYLDTIGRLPTPDETRAFLKDSSPEKRVRLVDELLERPEFVDYWTLWLADLLQNRKERDHDVRGTKGVRALHGWLRKQVAANRPWDEITRDVLTAKGDSFAEPEVGYFVVTVGEARRAEESDVGASVAQTFLGTRIGCAKCHNHPLEKYTQDDYYHFAAFFGRLALERQGPDKGPTTLHVETPEKGQLRRRIAQTEKRIAEAEAAETLDEKQQKQLANQREQLAKLQEELANFERQPVLVRQPRTGEMLRPQPLDRSPVAGDEPIADPRAALVDWMTGPGREDFAGNMVNRLVKHFLATGLVEPVDDLRPSNPPSNQALWDYLTGEFIGSGYDLKHVMRLILNSRTYQRDSATRPENENDRRFYSHFHARRLPAEVLLDAICDVTGVPEQFPGYPLGMRAVQVPDPAAKSYFLETFGRPERVTACACERSGEVTLPQLLHLQNGDWIAAKLQSSDGRLAQLLAVTPDDLAAAHELFLICLARPPRPEELPVVERLLADIEDRETAFRDLQWALMNTKEFAFNH